MVVVLETEALSCPGVSEERTPVNRNAIIQSVLWRCLIINLKRELYDPGDRWNRFFREIID
jgi:hypothetical protein